MRIAGWRNSVVVDLAGPSIPRQNAPIREAYAPLGYLYTAGSAQLE